MMPGKLSMMIAQKPKKNPQVLFKCLYKIYKSRTTMSNTRTLPYNSAA